MNFTREIKRELIREAPKRRCCMLALLSAVFKTSGCCSPETGRISFTSENEETAAYLLGLCEQLFSIQMILLSAVRDPKHGRDKLTFVYEDEGAKEFAREIADKDAASTLPDCCKREYIRGAFLGSGSCTLPGRGTKTGYHLEFIFSEYGAAENFSMLLESFQILANLLPRGEKFIVYLKSSEAISDLFSVMGTNGALAKLESVSAERRERGDENRMSNCYAFNADKAAIASAEQVLALQKMQKEGKFASLSEPLKETATARLLNPELSLKELAEKLNISKSCLFHRLKKLMTLV